MIAKIKGTGSCVPENVVDNNELSKMMETNDEWIRDRTGIARRHIAKGETTVSMSTEAGKRALENANVKPEEIDLIIVSTVSSDIVLPSTACEVQKNLGAVNATCYDMNAACTGFLFAYNTVQAYFYAGLFKKALIIGAETLSNIVDWTDRGTAILFGDGAGAAVLECVPGEMPPMVMHSDGGAGAALTCDSPFATKEKAFVKMNGQDVFRFAVKRVPESIEELFEKGNIDRNSIDYFILHQANSRIVEGIAKRLKMNISRFPMNLSEYGNTSSATIPILLDELNRQGVLQKGMKLVMAGFGAGLSWGASYLEWDL